jgi:hypothetical protein
MNHLSWICENSNANRVLTIFSDITPCCPLKVNRRLGGTYPLRLQGQRISYLLYDGILKQLEFKTGLKQANGLISGPPVRRTKDLLKLNRDQLRFVVGLFTGHCHLK